MAERDNLGPSRDHRPQTIEIDPAFARQLANPERRAPLDGELLPRDEVGVMLESCDYDLIPTLHVFSSPRGRDEIDGLSRPTGEDQTVAVGDSEEPRDPRSCSLVAIGRSNGQGVCAAMRIGVAGLVEVPDCVEYDIRLLRGRRRIDVMEAGIAGEQREVRLPAADREWAHDSISSAGI